MAVCCGYRETVQVVGLVHQHQDAGCEGEGEHSAAVTEALSKVICVSVPHELRAAEYHDSGVYRSREVSGAQSTFHALWPAEARPLSRHRGAELRGEKGRGAGQRGVSASELNRKKLLIL